MQTLENYRPKEGLSVPSITVLDENERVIEEDQRRVFRYNIQSGYGADIVFGVGTNGEWNRISNQQRLRVMEIEVDELRRINKQLETAGHRRAEAWVGVTANSKAETLSNLEVALELGADAGVIAPLSIEDLPEIVPFFRRDITRLFERKGKCLPLFLYDNADIAINPRVPHVRTRDVKMLSRLEYVRGIKVSASRKVLGNYTNASLRFKKEREFGVYVGNAMLIFDIFKPMRGVAGKVREYWNLHLLHNVIPIGVVSGPANVFPREWQKTWRVSYAGDEEMMSTYRQLHESFLQTCIFAEGGRKLMKLVAGIKYALHLKGVITSPHVARGTLALSNEQKKVFAERYHRLKDQVQATSDPLWISRWDQATGGLTMAVQARNEPSSTQV
jgi:dihydrodipicolinate synthase/N-acetylneuraminate lyase